jgi:phenylalanyl-tRNA synthetase alpha chain
MDGMHDLRAKYLEAVGGAADEAALEEVRLAAVGKKGEIALRMRELGQMSPEERMTVAPALNSLRDEVASAIAARKQALADAALDERLRAEWLDVTLPPRPRRVGTIHPVSQVMEEVTLIFAEMGFAVAEGPQVEDDWHNFDALNMAPEHPARAEHDTFYMHRGPGDNRPPHVLRTHTSPVQIRAMLSQGAPLRVIAPGRVFRADYDQTHSPMFHQVEGLAIDRDITMAQLKWTLEEFLKAFFEVDRWTCASAPRTSRSPSPRPRSTSAAPGKAARCAWARATAGSKPAARAWSTPTCCARAGSTPINGRASPSAWASTGWRC